MNPYLKRVGENKHGRYSEKKTARRLKGKVTPGSGNMEGAKGDIRLGTSFLVECKCTKSRSLSLKYDWLRKIFREASDIGRSPALALTFVDALGNPTPDGAWVLLPEKVFDELRQESDQRKEDVGERPASAISWGKTTC